MKNLQLRVRAFRFRHGTIGILECCGCNHPLEYYGTATGHAEACQAHAVTLSRRAVVARDRAMAVDELGALENVIRDAGFRIMELKTLLEQQGDALPDSEAP